jgi:hypothetical protein
MTDLPKLISLFDPPAQQKVVPGQASDYVAVYAVGSHITIVTEQPSGLVFPKVELWRPIFDCDLPAEVAASGNGRFFVIWFTGIPGERGNYGASVREVRVTGIARAKEGRELQPDEYVR